MEDMIYEQIEELNKDIGWKETERQMLEDPQYYIYNAVEQLRLAQDRLWNNGDRNTKDYVDKALNSAVIALKLLEG